MLRIENSIMQLIFFKSENFTALPPNTSGDVFSAGMIFHEIVMKVLTKKYTR